MEQYLISQKIPFDSPNEEKGNYDDVNDDNDEFGDSNDRMSSQTPQFFKWNVPQNTNNVENEKDDHQNAAHMQEHHHNNKNGFAIKHEKRQSQ